jgi:hypothetical protein
MKPLLGVILFVTLIGPAMAGPMLSKGKVQFADAASDACFASCSTQSDSCKRTCPTTFSGPCLSACDSQAQTCRQGCRR